MMIFHRYLLQHFQITAVSVIMLVILPLILSKLFTRRNSMSVVALVRAISVILLFVFVTVTFFIIGALWHLIIIISMSMFNMLVFHPVVDLAVILVFINM